MENISVWISSIVGASFIGAIVHMLAPEGGIKKAVRTVLSLFLILAVLSPFIKGGGIKINTQGIINPYEENKDQLQKELSAQLLRQAEESVRGIISEVLENEGIKAGQIYAEMDIENEGRIFIKKIKIELLKEDYRRKEKIKEQIKEKTGFTPEVYESR